MQCCIYLQWNIWWKSSQENITSPEEVFISLLQFSVGSSSLGAIREKVFQRNTKKIIES